MSLAKKATKARKATTMRKSEPRKMWFLWSYLVGGAGCAMPAATGAPSNSMGVRVATAGVADMVCELGPVWRRTWPDDADAGGEDAGDAAGESAGDGADALTGEDADAADARTGAEALTAAAAAADSLSEAMVVVYGY